MAGQFIGFFPVGEDATGPILVRDATGLPKDSSTTPTYKIYGPGGAEVQNGSGTATARDDGSISAIATQQGSYGNATVITSANHNLTNGSRVTIAGASGGTGTLNADWTITVIDASNFYLNSSTGISGSWTGGTWHVSGLYWWTHTLDESVFEPGVGYTVVGTATVSSIVVSSQDNFIVV